MFLPSPPGSLLFKGFSHIHKSTRQCPPRGRIFPLNEYNAILIANDDIDC